MSRRCYLQCLLNETKKMLLPENDTVILGRNRFTGLEDPHLSRKHLECTAEFKPDKLIVKTVGKCYSGCNGYALMLNETYTLKDGDVLELRLGYHKFKVVFENPNVEKNEPPEKKPKLFPIFNMEKRKTIATSSLLDICGKWESIDDNELLVFSPEGCPSQPRVASFDIDGTIIKTKSGARFPKDKNDWEINLNVIPKTLKELYEKQYKIVFFTNQSGVGKDSEKIRDFKYKIEKIISTLGIPVQVFIALGKGIYRKPVTGMWNVLSIRNDDIAVDIDESFYVGDAAGREKDWAPKRKKDHSSADRLYALNLGLKFYTPEEYFLKSSTNPFKMPVFDPRKLKNLEYPNYTTKTHNIILMVGSQGSGKSHFCKTELIPKNYVHINRDKLKSWEKCALMLEECISKKKNAVVDNTHPDKESRKKYIDIAKKHNVQCRCFVMSTTFEHCRHNNKFRGLTDKSHEVIGDMLLYAYRKKFEPPELSEGFSEILEIPFKAHFDSDNNEKLYRMFLLES